MLVAAHHCNCIWFQGFSRANNKKLDAHWLEVMRQAKTEELHAEIALLADEGWHTLKRKEGLVKVMSPVHLAHCPHQLYCELV